MTRLPPPGLPGLDPSWSRTVTAPDAEGTSRRWHVLDNAATPTLGTLLCVHGNPTWSYLWRGLLAAAPAGWRVVAPDQLGMGYSEGTERPRTVAQRVADLGRLTESLGIDGPVVTVGHDWGGIISLGWALGHRDQLRGVVLGNTAVAQPPGDHGPPLIRLAHLPGVRRLGCVTTPAFVRATSALSRPALPRDVRRALALPYADRAHRRAVGDFVADIPFSPQHPSYADVAALAEGVRSLDVPALLMWGPRDPVFGQRYLEDLRERMPQAVVHRFERASHLVTEDAPEYADAVVAWLEGPSPDPPGAHEPHPPVWAALEERAEDPGVALRISGRSLSWADLARRVRDLAAGLAAAGVRPGDRIGLLVEPSADLTAVVYAAWRAGAVVVVADKGLGFAGMRRALRGASLDHVVAGRAGLVAAQAMGLPGRRIATNDLDALARSGRGVPPPPTPSPDADCAVVFTSGATGPAKGVAYRHRQVSAQVALVRTTYGLGSHDRFVAAFAPFALLGPALGITSAVPDVDVTRPQTLTAPLLADAVAGIEATVVFASPAALRRVVATREALDDAQRAALGGVRLVMSAGAPVPVSLLERLRPLLPAASLRTPYGMTEALPVTDVGLEDLLEAGPGDGVCVGRPLPGVDVRIVAEGEICVRGAHVKDRYDALWLTEHESRRYPGWHRTGDVGHLDQDGRLWVEGRLAHVVRTADGLVTPVGPEQRVEALPGVSAAAVVGVGPAGAQVVVVVVVPSSRRVRGLRPASYELAEEVRRAAGLRVAAVLVTDRLPVDVRHASKVDRLEVGRRAARVLAGHSG